MMKKFKRKVCEKSNFVRLRIVFADNYFKKEKLMLTQNLQQSFQKAIILKYVNMHQVEES